MKSIIKWAGSQGLCSVTANENKILIITIQAAKHLSYLLMFCGLNCVHTLALAVHFDFTSFSSWPFCFQLGCYFSQSGLGDNFLPNLTTKKLANTL